MKTGIIVQARMGSTRLPGKVMMELSGKPVLWHVLERVRQCRHVDEIIVATTVSAQDDVIERFSSAYGVFCHRGSDDDVLDRYYHAALCRQLDWIIRVTSDCPLIDAPVIDDMLAVLHAGQNSFVTNVNLDPLARTFPRGLDAEAFSMRLLTLAHTHAKEPYQREHVTPYMYEFAHDIHYHTFPTNEAQYRLTLDTTEDYRMLSAVFSFLYQGRHDFWLKEILTVLRRHPELVDINREVRQKPIKEPGAGGT